MHTLCAKEVFKTFKNLQLEIRNVSVLRRTREPKDAKAEKKKKDDEKLTELKVTRLNHSIMEWLFRHSFKLFSPLSSCEDLLIKLFTIYDIDLHAKRIFTQTFESSVYGELVFATQIEIYILNSQT